jgi:hypothetical protein
MKASSRRENQVQALSERARREPGDPFQHGYFQSTVTIIRSHHSGTTCNVQFTEPWTRQADCQHSNNPGSNPSTAAPEEEEKLPPFWSSLALSLLSGCAMIFDYHVPESCRVQYHTWYQMQA